MFDKKYKTKFSRKKGEREKHQLLSSFMKICLKWHLVLHMWSTDSFPALYEGLHLVRFPNPLLGSGLEFQYPKKWEIFRVLETQLIFTAVGEPD